MTPSHINVPRAEAAPALLLIDIQQGLIPYAPYYGGQRNNPNAETRAAALLSFWREKSWPVYHVKNDSTNPDSPLYPGKPGNAIHPAVQPLPEEPLLKKTANSAFIGTDLQERLQVAGIEQLVVAGLTTDHCISSTVRMAANYGYDVHLAGDATAAYERTTPSGQHFTAQVMHAVNLASLQGEFCQVKTVEALCLFFADKAQSGI